MGHDELTSRAMPGYIPPVGGEKRYYPEISDDECVDGYDEVWPEHDFPPVGEGYECRRCGAEAGD